MDLVIRIFSNFSSVKHTKCNAQEVYHSSTGKQKATTEKEDDDDGSKIVVDRQGVKTIYTDKSFIIIILRLLFRDT